MNLLAILRAALRLAGFLAVAVAALADFILRRCGRGVSARAAWQQTWARRFLQVLNVEVELRGALPESGVLVANHLSYLDIAALALACPMAFVAKAEVRHWPLLGWLARCGGALFVDRERRSDIARLAPHFAPVVHSGVVLAIFPEGTSTGGDRVLPFHSSLLAPAAEHGWPVTPGWIGYELEDGSVADEVCYWRDMTFATHFLNLLTKRRIRGVVAFGEPLRNTDRKELARDLHAAVCFLRERHQHFPMKTTCSPNELDRPRAPRPCPVETR